MSSPGAEVRHTGGCQCGALRYAIDATPVALYVCHCRECQKQSASAFGISVIVASEALRLLRGRPRRWSRPTDSGSTLDCYFCPECGTRVWHGDPAREATVSVKGGSLDVPVDLRDADHIWTRRKLPGVAIPTGVRQFPEEPT